MAKLVSLSASSASAIQAAQVRRPSGSAGAAMFGSPAGSMKNDGKRLLLPRDGADVRGVLVKGSGGCSGLMGKRAAMVVRASSTIGYVKEVRTEVEDIYYNVRLGIPLQSDVAKWYQTPGQYVDLLRTNSAHNDARSFFIATPPKSLIHAGTQLSLEFLIEDVTGTVANELINSQRGDAVIVSTNCFSNGFNLQPLEAAEHVLMFASSYGIGSLRALIEKGFQATQKKTAILYTMYEPGQEPYMDKHAMWKLSGVTVEPFRNCVEVIDPAKTVVLINASQTEQAKLTKCFLEKGVPSDQILVLWPGIPTKDEAFINKVRGEPNFLHMGELHVPFALAI